MIFLLLFHTEPKIGVVTEDTQIVFATMTTWRHLVTLPLTMQWWLRWGPSLSVFSNWGSNTSRHIGKDKAATCTTTRKTFMNSSFDDTNRWVAVDVLVPNFRNLQRSLEDFFSKERMRIFETSLENVWKNLRRFSKEDFEKGCTIFETVLETFGKKLGKCVGKH